MKTSLLHRGYKGFTLIELLVVIAIIGLLSTVIAAPITEARRKGRDSKKISDVRAIVTAINIYSDDNGGVYPPNLSALVPRYLPNLPSAATASTTARDKYMYVAYVDSVVGVVGYHLGVKLESANQALNDDADCGGEDAPLSGSTKSCIGAVASSTIPYDCTGGTCSISNTNYAANGAGHPAASSATTDFGGSSDTGTTACTSALTTCIYDLTN